MVSLNFLSRQSVLLLTAVLLAQDLFAQSAELPLEGSNLGYWAVAGLMGILAAWWLGKQEGREVEKLLKTYKRQLTTLKHKLSDLEEQLKAKDEGIHVLEQKLSNALALKDQAIADSFSRDQFVAMVSQQMRDPLNEISTALRALSKDIDEEDLEDHLYEIETATNDLVLYINDILDQCKLEAGKVVLEERKFEVRALIKEVWDQVEADSPCSVCSSDVQIHPRVPVSLVGDTIRLRQILSNLFQCVLNVEGVAEVRFLVTPQDLFLRNATLKFTVEGKSDSTHDAGDSLEALVPNDSPLLKNTKRLVRLQNGKMIVKKGDQGHLMVQVWLPFRLPGHVETSADGFPVRKTSAIEQTLNGYQILVAEDNKITQTVVAKVLRDRGAEVTLVGNGQEAVNKFEEKHFDLLIMDINMPVMDGYQAVSKIRRMEQGRGAKVPIIALTSSVLLTNKEKALLHGMDEYVGKPFSIDDLMDKVSFCLYDLKQAR